MKKTQTLKMRSEARLRELRPVWVGAVVGFAIFWLYCVLRPVAPWALNPYFLTYPAICRIYYTGGYTL